MIDVKRPFTFAVVSDTHFVRREFRDADARHTNPLDAESYVENVTYALAPMIDALREMDPDLLIISGDIVEPGDQGLDAADLQAALAFFSACEIPILYARGNHDALVPFQEIVRPANAHILNQNLKSDYFSFVIDGCLFFVLDSASWDQVQCRWLETHLQDTIGRHYDHIFIVGHHPVWPVSRAFFTPFDFHCDMERLLNDYDVDAYFCGHTHNQNVVLHRTRGLPVFQFMGAIIGVSDEPPLALDQIQSLLLDDEDLLAMWPGYLENTAPGWFMVSVQKERVTTEWHHLNRGAEAVVAWERPGELLDFWMMAQNPPARLIPLDLRRIRRGYLRFCGWDCVTGLRASINGADIGDLPLRDGFAHARFELPGHILSYLQLENRLMITPPENCATTLGNLMLEVMLPGGRYIRTQATKKLFSWSDKWAQWNSSHLTQLDEGEALHFMLMFE